MPVDSSETDLPEGNIYAFLKENRDKAYTKDELKEELDIETIGSMHTYTTFRPFAWKREFYDGQSVYTLQWNKFLLAVVAIGVPVLALLLWLLITNPSAFYTCGL